MIDKREITPELLARLTVLLFTKISSRDVLEGRIHFDDLPCEIISEVMLEDAYFNQSQSKLGCESYARSVIDYVAEKTEWLNGHRPYRVDHLNVFDLLLLTLNDLLVMNQNRINCSYQEIFSWRMLVRFIGEELPVSIGYAQWDYDHGRLARDTVDLFSWPYVTEHNNKQLNMIVRRGVSDHHCHLYASTPYFHVSWVNLMNRLTNNLYQQNLQRLGLARKPGNVDSVGCKDTLQEDWLNDSGEIKQLRAAWIRLYLCERISGKPSQAEQCVPLKNVCCYSDWRQLLLNRDKLQSLLEAYSYAANRTSDYALSIANLRRDTFCSEYDMLIGERWLYYHIFMDYCKPGPQRHLSNNEYNLFYAYFLFRAQVRSQMVQNNDFMGFDNFQEIQGRKSYFLDNTKSERSLIRLAINETLKKPFVRELEVRITPETKQIERLEKMVALDSQNELQDRYYYVFHFIKQCDSKLTEDPSYDRSIKTGRICRHHVLRRKTMKQAKRIIRFREQQPLLARRVLGIDAASQEIGCRPEVFGPIYRLLGNHQCCYGGLKEEKVPLPALGKTYHVAEDFDDVVDGLRAIDEVIHFLDFDCGDRLGHAIALGINVAEWYEQKHREISVSVQDYLDNLAWLYHALTHFFVPNVHALKERIVRDFEYWFRIVYRNSISDHKIKSVMASARKQCYDVTQEDHGRYHEHTCHFDIMDYYRSWTLRGDDPMCYVDGYFRKPKEYSRLIGEEKSKVNDSFPVHYEDRYVAEYSILNYLYQFDERVYSGGKRRIKVDISEEYICAVKAVQIEMRYRLARRGISIETNPTSNVLISTFREYEKHPILAFYNRGLPVTQVEEEECAQLQVSINTDDSGVFYTDLETEYALLARSVEQIKDSNERPRFKKTDIYTWIDHIRSMGIDQTFRQQE